MLEKHSHAYIVLAGITPHLALDLGLNFGIRYEVKTRQCQLPLPLSPPAALLLSSHPPSSLLPTGMPSLLLPSSMTAFQPQEAMCQPVDHHRRGNTSWLMKKESASGVFRTDDNWSDISSLPRCILSTDHSADKRGRELQPEGALERGRLFWCRWFYSDLRVGTGSTLKPIWDRVELYFPGEQWEQQAVMCSKVKSPKAETMLRQGHCGSSACTTT